MIEVGEGRHALKFLVLSDGDGVIILPFQYTPWKKRAGRRWARQVGGT